MIVATVKRILSPYNQYRKWVGGFLMILACCSMCYCAVIVKLMHKLNTSQILLYRSTFSFICNLPNVSKETVFFNDEHLSRMLYIRMVFAGVIDFCMIGAQQYLKLSEATSIMLTYPIIKCCFAKIFLEEPMRRSLLIPFILSCLGVLCIVKPHAFTSLFMSAEQAALDAVLPESKELRDIVLRERFGYFLAITFSLGLSTMDVIIYHTRRRISSATIVQYGYFGSIITSGLMIVWREYNAFSLTLPTLLLLSSAGLSYFAGQMLFGKALQLARSKITIPMTYLQIVIQVVIDIYLFGQQLSLISLFGSALIILGNVRNITS